MKPVLALAAVIAAIGASQGSNFGAIVLLVIAILLYFLPVLIADARRHHQRMAIGVLNLFLGWTLLGWIAALVWACTHTPGIAAMRRS